MKRECECIFHRLWHSWKYKSFYIQSPIAVMSYLLLIRNRPYQILKICRQVFLCWKFIHFYSFDRCVSCRRELCRGVWGLWAFFLGWQILTCIVTWLDKDPYQDDFRIIVRFNYPTVICFSVVKIIKLCFLLVVSLSFLFSECIS